MIHLEPDDAKNDRQRIYSCEAKEAKHNVYIHVVTHIKSSVMIWELTSRLKEYTCRWMRML